MELKSICRPDYIELGTVPYLDWGYGLSPTYRDKKYPILAIAWGKTIQLAVYVNQSSVSGVDDPIIQYDGFYICDGFTIDTCFFLSESLLFILVNTKDVRILYTQNFTPGIYDEHLLRNSQNMIKDSLERKKAFMTIKDKYSGSVSLYAEKDKGYRLLQDEIRHKDILIDNQFKRSRYNFNPTVRKNDDNVVVALGKTTIGQGNLLHWEEYLDLIRKTNPDDWLKVLRAALDIYNGKTIGFAGLPDQQEVREQLLRESMKDLLRQNINTCIREFQEGQSISKKTLRVALEFCIRVGAIDHLFGELFQMFAEAGMEQKYFENLEAFVLSGKLKNTKIPDQILSRMMQYYRQKDRELLEKAILNVDLTNYSDILEIRHICETEYLTSALIHLLTNLFDTDKDLLCTLFNLILKSKEVVDKKEVFKILGKDIQLIQEEEKSQQNNQEKQIIDKVQKGQIQQSQTYLGYKLLWVIKLFMEGKKFPNGSLSTVKWQTYVYDIVRFTTNEQYLRWFLDFDPDCFFKLMKILFLDQEPYTYIASQQAFIEMYQDQFTGGIDYCMNHEEIIEKIHRAVLNFLYKDKEISQGGQTIKGEQLINSYIFFISQISRKTQIKISEELCIFVIQEMLRFHQKLLKIPNLQDITNRLLIQPSKTANNKDLRGFIYQNLVRKNEKDVLSLIQRCESSLNEDDINALLLEADSSPMYKVRIYLHQLLGNYQRCLTMFFQIAPIKEEVFQWLKDIHYNKHNEKDQMKKLIIKNISSFVEMNPQQTIKLTNSWFDGDHMLIVQSLNNHSELIYKYISTILSEKEDIIQAEFNQILFSGNKEISRVYNEYKELILIFVNTLCQKKFKNEIVEFVKKKYYPIDDCLKICEEKKQYEACAILYKRKGEYQKSISLYLQVLLDLSINEILVQLMVTAHIKFNDPKTKNKHIVKFDNLLMEIIKICDKYGKKLPDQEEGEKLWLYGINGLYDLKNQVFEKAKEIKKKDQRSFSEFLTIRTQEFMKRMSEFVNLRKVIQFLEEIGEPIKYQEFKQAFEEKMRIELYTENILTNAKDLVIKDLVADTEILKMIHVIIVLLIVIVKRILQ